MMHIDRHFLFLHGENLAVFTERVLRNTLRNPNYAVSPELWGNVNHACSNLRQIMSDPFLKRKDRTDAIRDQESVLLVELEKFAVHVENNVHFKSDVLSTGFHLHTDNARNDTRRKQRMNMRMARLAID